MKALSEFPSIEEARAYEHVTYRKIGGNEATQIFSLLGALDSIEANKDSTVSVEVITGVPTSVGALCRSLLQTLNGGQFATDPTEEDGQLNRAASQVLVTNSVLEQAQHDAFFAKAIASKDKPYASKTLHDFEVDKGTVVRKEATQTALGDSIVVEVTADAQENHTPRITDSSGNQVSRVYNVHKVGLYVASIPNDKRGQTLYVDDTYGVIV
jgi:hypothetical protein